MIPSIVHAVVLSNQWPKGSTGSVSIIVWFALPTILRQHADVYAQVIVTSWKLASAYQSAPGITIILFTKKPPHSPRQEL